MKTILDLDNKQACKFFMESENYCNIDLPPYFNFDPILDYVKSMCGQVKSLGGIQKKDENGENIYPSQFSDVNYSILANKDGRYAFRPLQIANPYSYFFLVRTITEKSNWEELMNLLKVTYHIGNTEVASIPKVKDYDTRKQPRNKYDIEGYIELFEQRAVALSLEYKYVFVTDITNCYGSMYTHSIAWAVNGKKFAKAHKGYNDSLGNKIDRQIQWIQYNQTNGIPQGSILFDFIAEIVLGYADKLLYDELKDKVSSDYKILRYRDDYKIFNNDIQELETISYTLQKILAKLNMTLNSGKTKIGEDVITLAYKEDKLAHIESTPIYFHKKSLFTTVQKELLYIRCFSKQHPNSGQSQRMLTDLQKRISRQNVGMKQINAGEDHEHWNSVIAILVDMAIDNPKLYSNIVALLSIALSKFSEKDVQSALVHKICDKLWFLPNKGILQLWLQRITLPLIDEKMSYKEKLCGVVDNMPDIQLWNIAWVDDKYTKNFPLYDIVDKEKLKDLEPIVKANEFSSFEY